MRVHPKAHPWHYQVVIDDPQAAETHPVRVVVIRKTKSMVGIQPTVLGVASFDQLRAAAVAIKARCDDLDSLGG